MRHLSLPIISQAFWRHLFPEELHFKRFLYEVSIELAKQRAFSLWGGKPQFLKMEVFSWEHTLQFLIA